MGKQFRFRNFDQFIYDTVPVVSLTISRLKTNMVSQNDLCCVKRDNLARQHCSKKITKFAKKETWGKHLSKKQSPVGKQSFVHFSQSVRVCFANQVEVCTILVLTWICQSCYIYLSKSLHVFVKFLHVLFDSDIELNWLCLLNSHFATCSNILYFYPKYLRNCLMMKQSLLIEVKHSNELKNSMPVAHMLKKGVVPLDQEQVIWECK